MNASVMNIEPTRAAGPERSWEVLCHLAPLVGYLMVFGGVLGPLIVWLVKKAEYPSVDAHGREVLNFQISWLIYGLLSVPLCFIVIGIPIALLLYVSGFILSIVGGLKASNGEMYRYPLTLRFL